MEDILTQTDDRFVLFPIKHHDIWDLYKKALSSFWTVDELDFSTDVSDWETKLNDNERFFIKNILAFFAASDGIVNENLALKFYNEIQVPEIRNLYSSQILIEAIHSECVVGDTLVLTSEGYLKIKDLVGNVVKIWNGKRWSEVLVENTGQKQIYSIELSNGLELKCSQYHTWYLDSGLYYPDTKCKSYDLKCGDFLDKDYDLPILHIDNNNFKYPRKHAYFSSTEYSFFSIYNIIDTLAYPDIFYKIPRYTVPINYSKEIKLEYIKGLLDSECSEIEETEANIYSLYVYSKNKSYLQNISLLLTTFNIKCDIVFSETIERTIYKIWFILLTNTDLLYLKYQGLDHPKLNVLDMDFYKEKKSYTNVSIKNVKNTKTLQDTFCFHETLEGKGIFNGIFTGQCYSLMIDTFIKNKKEKELLFNSLQNNEIVAKKARWALKWINDSNSFAERLLAFGAVEGIFFSGSFCSIFWLKERNLMPSLVASNQFISRDESLHCETCVVIYSKLKNKLPQKRVHEIFMEAYEIETEFITKSLPVNLIGMNVILMKQYIQFVTDYWLTKLNYSKLFNVENPFGFMNYISLETKTNFFDKRPTEYTKAILTKFDLDEEF